MGFIGAQELLVILAIVVLLFGAKKIPELARGLGIGIKEFKKASSEFEKEVDPKSSGEKNEEKKQVLVKK